MIKVFESEFNKDDLRNLFKNTLYKSLCDIGYKYGYKPSKMDNALYWRDW